MPQSQTELQHIESIKARIGGKEFIILIAALMAINSVAIDIMLPSMGEIAHSLHATGKNDQHYIIFSFLISYGLSQIVFGPISDRYGRRIPILAGLVFYSLSSFACIFAPTFTWLLILRFIQGFGAAATRVLTISVVRDLYNGRRMAEVMSIVMMVFMVVPVLAPAIGQGLVMIFHDWKVIFIFMGVTGLVIALWVYFRLPETLYEARPLTFSSVGLGFKTVLSNRTSLCYTLALSVVMGGLFTSLNTAEQIYRDIYHLGVWFPLAFAAVVVFQALSSFLNSRFVGRFGMRIISHTLLLSYTLSALCWFIGCLLSPTGSVPLTAYLILFMWLMFSFGGLGANFNALAMEPLGKVAGTASSIFGFLQTTIGAGIGFLIAQQFNGTTRPIAAGFFAIAVVALLLVLIAEKGRLFVKARPSAMHSPMQNGPAPE